MRYKGYKGGVIIAEFINFNPLLLIVVIFGFINFTLMLIYLIRSPRLLLKIYINICLTFYIINLINYIN